MEKNAIILTLVNILWQLLYGVPISNIPIDLFEKEIDTIENSLTFNYQDDSSSIEMMMARFEKLSVFPNLVKSSWAGWGGWRVWGIWGDPDEEEES